jgi:hypothetical protein
MPPPIPTFIWTSKTTTNPPDNSPIIAEVSNSYIEGARYEIPYHPTNTMPAIPEQTELGPDTEVANTNTEEQYTTDYKVAAATEAPSQSLEETPQQSAPDRTVSNNTTEDSKLMHFGSQQDGPKSDAEELIALRETNALLTQRLRELEGENPEERDARKLKLKNDEVDELKASVEQTHNETELIKQEHAKQQVYLRELHAQIAALQPPLQFALKETRKKGKK